MASPYPRAGAGGTATGGAAQRRRVREDAPVIEVDDDAPPAVLGVAGTLRRAQRDPKLAHQLARMKGVLALRSSVDAQAVTARFDGGRVRVSPGVADDADVVITLDFNDPSAKPKVSGAARHPMLALGASKVLEPAPGTWQEEARSFWAFAGDTARMPRALSVRCTDDGSSLVLGEGPPQYEIEGTAAALGSMFSGASVFGDDLLNGKLFAVGSLEHASVLTGRSIAWALGEGR